MVVTSIVVTAAAIAFALNQNDETPEEIKIQTKGGELKVLLQENQGSGFQDIWLCGPAEQVFSGIIVLRTEDLA